MREGIVQASHPTRGGASALAEAYWAFLDTSTATGFPRLTAGVQFLGRGDGPANFCREVDMLFEVSTPDAVAAGSLSRSNDRTP